jgi:signal transduction histidine kinase
VADRAHVFERFRRGTASATTASGSGLGLAIVQAATRQMGAHIELKDGLQDGAGGSGLSVTLRWRAMPAAR